MRIHVITTEPTHPTIAGNRARIVSMIDELMRMGHDIRLLLVLCKDEDVLAVREHYGERVDSLSWRDLNPDSAKGKRLSLGRMIMMLRKQIGSRIPKGWKIWKKSEPLRTSSEDIDDKMREPLAKACAARVMEHTPDAVIVNYVYNSHMLDYIPDHVMKVIDTHDLFTDRFKIFQTLGIDPEFYSFTREAEQKGLRRAHKLIAITEEEKIVFDGMGCPECTVVGYMDQIISDDISNHARDASRPVSFGILASKNMLNKTSLDWLIDRVMAQACLKNADFKVLVGGNINGFYEKTRLDSRIQFLGRVDYDEFYGNTHVILNPMILGTGLKIKSCEALVRGMPLITTQAGATGLTSGSGTAFLTAGSPEEFAKHMLACIEDGDLRRNLSTRALEFMEAYVDAQRKALEKVFLSNSH